MEATSPTPEPWTTLIAMREKDGHTMASLAKTAGISPGYLNDLEKGRRNPGPAVTRKLAAALNVPASAIEKYRRAPKAVAA
jgi:transcriptional regulator with XRE-family HTH domain